MTYHMALSDDRPGKSVGNVRGSLPARSAGDLKSLVAALTTLTALGHDRMTVKQALFFLAVGYHQAMGETVTVTKIREIYEQLGRSIEKSKDQFLAPTPRSPDSLGWMEQFEDADDRRLRYLDLTQDGADVLSDMIEAMRHA